MSDKEDEDRAEAKKQMLEQIDDVRRRVAIGDVTGITIVADKHDGYVVRRIAGDSPSPVAILVLEEIINTARTLFLSKNQRFDMGKPSIAVVTMLRPVDDDEEDSDD